MEIEDVQQISKLNRLKAGINDVAYVGDKKDATTSS